MNHRVFWSDEAAANVDAIEEFIFAYNPKAARRLTERFYDAASSLREFPDRGRESGPGTRELTIVWPYIIRYAVADEEVTIIRIRHDARQPD